MYKLQKIGFLGNILGWSFLTVAFITGIKVFSVIALLPFVMSVGIFTYLILFREKSVDNIENSESNDAFQSKVLEYCFEKGLRDVVIQPDQYGKLSLYDFSRKANGLFYIICPLTVCLVNEGSKEWNIAWKNITSEIDDYLIIEEQRKKEENENKID
jgi:hypothetical protein